jgi:hypothetical protein
MSRPIGLISLAAAVVLLFLGALNEEETDGFCGSTRLPWSIRPSS